VGKQTGVAPRIAMRLRSDLRGLVAAIYNDMLVKCPTPAVDILGYKQTE
jgi:hypothetical protein